MTRKTSRRKDSAQSHLAKTIRKNREKRGRRAEWLAAFYLRFKGYRIVQTRVRMRCGEIDIIAVKGSIIAFIEVKARKTIEMGLNAVTYESWARIARTAEIWMSHKQQYSNLDWRYDLIVISPFRLPKHKSDFWRPH